MLAAAIGSPLRRLDTTGAGARLRVLAFLAVSVCLESGAPQMARAATPAAQREAVANWPKLPDRHVLGQCVGVGVDSQDHVWVFHRSGRTWGSPFPTQPIAEPTVSRLDGRTGELLATWGTNEFIMPHGLTVDHEDNLWLTDVGRQQVFKFNREGRLLLALGERGQAGNDRTHFNLPTDVAVLRDGSFYVSDGYRNTRVVKFTADGRYDFEWGTKGAAPGEFNLPHGVVVDLRGRVIVCDRTNSRLQVFDPRGKFLAEWKGPLIGRPYGVAVSHAGHVFLIDGGDAPARSTDRPRAVELDAEGKILDRFGTGGTGDGAFQLGHDIAVARDGAVYVADAAGKRLHKFVLKR